MTGTEQAAVLAPAQLQALADVERALEDRLEDDRAVAPDPGLYLDVLVILVLLAAVRELAGRPPVVFGEALGVSA